MFSSAVKGKERALLKKVRPEYSTKIAALKSEVLKKQIRLSFSPDLFSIGVLLAVSFIEALAN